MAKDTVSKDARLSEGSTCYLMVPPFFKYAAGPILGPAILEGTAKKQGLRVRTIDLNIEYIRFMDPFQMESGLSTKFYGDHAKPSGHLDKVEYNFWRTIENGFNKKPILSASQIKKGWYSHSQLYNAVECLSDSPLGVFIRDNLDNLSKPPLLGVSIMWGGQIVAGMLVSMLAKLKWPNTKIVWGGPHMTSIIEEVIQSKEFGRWVDGYMPGRCEESFIKLLNSIMKGKFEAPGLVVPGQGNPVNVATPISSPSYPEFPDLTRYGYPILTIPMQLGIGCIYSRCSFCTYPTIEGKYRNLPIEWLDRLIHLAVEKDATISFKDSLVPPNLLRDISDVVSGKVEWSACTKLSPCLDKKLLVHIEQGGCRTLEVGLESLDPKTQLRINKKTSTEVLDRFLKNASFAGISVIINYITGFPWEESEKTEEILRNLKRRLKTHKGLVACVEHNNFDLERLSPMAQNPAKYDILITNSWPWSSILEWKTRKKTHMIEVMPRQLRG